jgi:hypothetical protein
MKQHIDSMHTSIQRLETCNDKVTDLTCEIHDVLRPNRQKIARTSVKYEILRKVLETSFLTTRSLLNPTDGFVFSLVTIYLRYANSTSKIC